MARTIPDSERTSTAILKNNDSPPQSNVRHFFPGSTFIGLVLPAVIYSVAMHASLKVLNYIPFSSRFMIEAEILHPENCMSSSPASIAIVTGSNTGVGFATASGLAERGYHVILACRSRQKGEAAAEKINTCVETLSSSNNQSYSHFVPGGKASFLHPLDLSSFASVRSFCKEYCRKYKYLNILVNNAGINSQGDITEDGLEICFQSNFVGHFLLTKLLLPRLLAAKNIYTNDSTNESSQEAGRVVNLSSVTHHFAPANERTIPKKYPPKEYPPNNGVHDQHFWHGSAIPGVSTATYRESKLASILFSMELNKQFGDRGLRSIAVNPGSVASDIWRNESKLTQKIYNLFYLSPQQGCSTSIAGAIGNFPTKAIYLQPYWKPEFWNLHQVSSTKHTSFHRTYSLPFPMFEMLGPYVGYAVTEPRLPVDGHGGYKSSKDLWSVCEKLTSPT